MKTSVLFALAATAASGVQAWSKSPFAKGFNVVANLPNGDCRTEADWEAAFNKIASFPGKFQSARLYASSDCDTLARAVPAAIKTKTSLLVGIWSVDKSHYEAEKGALVEAIQQHGHDWILAVSVGSESLFRKEENPRALAAKIYDVRGMLWGLGATSTTVGHVDSWPAWVDPVNRPVIEAVDWIGNDVYPYFEGKDIDNGAANAAYWSGVEKVRAVAQGKDVWTTETGWPITGETLGAAVPSVQNLQTYWWQVACASIPEMNFFWYSLDDFGWPIFSVVDRRGKALIDLSCGS